MTGFRVAMGSVTLLMLLVLLPSAGSSAESPTVQLRIDADTSLGPVKPLFRDFCQGGESGDAEYLECLIDDMRALRPRMIRFDNAITSFVSRPPSGKGYDFTRFDKAISVIKEMGAEPLVCLSYTPEEYRSGGSDISPPQDTKGYCDLVEALVRHANQVRDFNIRYWEIWNEPNHAGFWSGTLDDYLNLYGLMAASVRMADPTVKIGGPGLSSFDERWVDGFLDYVTRNKLPMDFLSWHLYMQPPEEYVRTAESARNKLDALGLKAELILDEWNYHAGMVPQNDDHRGAAYIAATLRHLIDSPLDYAPFFEPRDGWSPKAEWYGRWGMFTFKESPKANYYTFQAFSRLAEQRIQLETNQPGIDGIATREGDRVMAVVYNNTPEDHWSGVTLKGLPGSSYLMTRWLVDAVHSNPVYNTPWELQRVERASCIASEKRLSRRMLLPQYSVSLVEFRPDPDAIPALLKIWPESGSHMGSVPFQFIADATGYSPGDLEVSVSSEVDADRIAPRSVLSNIPTMAPIVRSCTPSLGYYEGWRFYEVTVTPKDDSTKHFRESLAYYLPSRMTATPQRNRIPGLEGEPVFLDITNREIKPLKGSVRWSTDSDSGLELTSISGDFDVPPASSSTVESSILTTLSATEAIDLECQISFDDGYKNSRTFAVAPVLIAQHGQGTVQTHVLPRIQYVDWIPKTIGRLTVSIAASWDEDALQMEIQVPDEVHLPSATPEAMFLGDSLQMAFDMGFDAKPGSEYDTNDYDDNDYEYGMSSRGAWCWQAGAGGTTGRRTDIGVTFKQSDRGAHYRVTIPWDALGSYQPAKGRAFGFSLLINDEDGSRRTCATLFGDISGPKKPWRFGAIVLKS